MRLYIDTSTPTFRIRLDEHEYVWESNRELAKNIFQYIHDSLKNEGSDWQDLTEIVCFSGPGSFTGLRIGATVANALADQLQIPLYDHHLERKSIIMPEYGREANISAPRK